MNKIGGKRWLAYIVTNVIFVWIIRSLLILFAENKDLAMVTQITIMFAAYVTFVMAWAKLEKDKRGGS